MLRGEANKETLSFRDASSFAYPRNIYVDEAEFTFRKEKMFCFLLVCAHLRNIVSNTDAKCFCSNVFQVCADL